MRVSALVFCLMVVQYFQDKFNSEKFLLGSPAMHNGDYSHC